jgi:hypothetical protein
MSIFFDKDKLNNAFIVVVVVVIVVMIPLVDIEIGWHFTPSHYVH